MDARRKIGIVACRHSVSTLHVDIACQRFAMYHLTNFFYHAQWSAGAMMRMQPNVVVVDLYPPGQSLSLSSISAPSLLLTTFRDDGGVRLQHGVVPRGLHVSVLCTVVTMHGRYLLLCRYVCRPLMSRRSSALASRDARTARTARLSTSSRRH
jgi:hypothetical protein